MYLYAKIMFAQQSNIRKFVHTVAVTLLTLGNRINNELFPGIIWSMAIKSYMLNRLFSINYIAVKIILPTLVYIYMVIFLQ